MSASSTALEFDLHDRSHSVELEYETSSSAAWSSKAVRSNSFGTQLGDSSSLPATCVLFADRLFELFQSARLFCDDLTEEQLENALRDAIRIRNSGLFPEYITPDVGVDEYGEFSFSVKSLKGYLDIGVNGGNEISFHVRNDSDPSLTAFGDLEWDRPGLPSELVESAVRFLND